MLSLFVLLSGGLVMSDEITVIAPAPPAVPAGDYVTRAELEALLALQRNETDQRVDQVAEVAYDASATANQAQDTASYAETIADVAAEIAGEAAETAVEAVEGAETADDTGTGPKGAQPHDQAPAREDHDGQPAKRSKYGAGWLYGR